MQNWKTRLDNYWYYYKWHTLSVFVLLAVLIVGIRSCKKKDYGDVYVLYITAKRDFSTRTQELEKWLSPQVPDLDQNGKSEAVVRKVSIYSQSGDYDANLLATAIASEAAILYVVDGDIYKTLQENGALQSLDFLGDCPYVVENRLSIRKSGILDESKAWSQGYYHFCLRKTQTTDLPTDQRHREQEKIAKELLQKWASN